MDFEQAHRLLIEHHISRRSGERRGRLDRGHGYGEKLLLQNVWWPLFGNFDHLHPEYEVFDWNRKSQFLDFAFITPFGRFGLECDGYQSHVKDMDREKFSYALNRDTFLTGIGWRMLHFAFDDVKDRPEICRMLLQLAIGPIGMRAASTSRLALMERELIFLAWSKGGRLRPIEACDHLGINFRTVKSILHALVEKGVMAVNTNGKIIRYYVLKEAPLERLLG